MYFTPGSQDVRMIVNRAKNKISSLFVLIFLVVLQCLKVVHNGYVYLSSCVYFGIICNWDIRFVAVGQWFAIFCFYTS